MVRRVIGASAAPTPDFSPFRAVTPAAGLTSFFRQPGTMSIPESEFTQVAQALQSISPTLNRVIGDQAEAANRAAADQGRIDAEKLNAEQARQAMSGNFVELERTNQIPVGASPFRLAAMQASLGKKAIENDLRQILNQNLGRFTDPYSKEDPAQFVQQEFAKIVKERGMEFYAKGAATEALDQVESAFLNRTSAIKAESVSKQNDKDLISGLFIELTKDYEGLSPEQVSSTRREAVRKALQEHYTTTGKSGRPQIIDAVSDAARGLAADGKKEEALALISVVDKIEIGGVQLQRSEALALENLEDQVDTLAEGAQADEERRLNRQATLRKTAADTVVSALRGSLTSDELQALDLDNPDTRQKINEELTAAGLEGKALDAARGDVIAGLQAAKRAIPIDAEVLAKIASSISDPTTSVEVNETLLNTYASQMSPAQVLLYTNQINAKKSRRTNINDLVNKTRDEEEILVKAVEESLADPFSEDRQIALMALFLGDIRTLRDDVAQQVADGKLTPEAMPRVYMAGLRKLRDSFDKDISQDRNKQLRDDTRPEIRTLIQDERLEKAPDEARPGILEAEAPGLLSLFARRSVPVAKLERLQEGTQSEEEKQKDKATLRSGAVKILNDMAQGRRGPLARFFTLGGRRLEDGEGVPDGLVREEILLRALVVGFDLDEIKTGKTKFGTPIPKTADGNSILNPRHTLLFPGLTSLKDAEDFFKQDQKDGYRRVEAVMRALPPQYRTGLDKESVETFIRLQKNHIKLYLPSSNQEQ